MAYEQEVSDFDLTFAMPPLDNEQHLESVHTITAIPKTTGIIISQRVVLTKQTKPCRSLVLVPVGQREGGPHPGARLCKFATGGAPRQLPLRVD